MATRGVVRRFYAKVKSPADHSSTALFRIILAGFFLLAGVSKLADPISFFAAIKGYQLPLPDMLARLAVMVVPWIEVVCAVLLLFKLRVVSCLFSLLALLAVFVMLTGQAWLRGLEISCGCINLKLLGLGESDAMLGRIIESVGFATLRNVLLAGIVVFLLHRLQQDSEPLSEQQGGFHKDHAS
jgi:uncharacterized membrane protein YphA (DoxX/SURF4 family)